MHHALLIISHQGDPSHSANHQYTARAMGLMIQPNTIITGGSNTRPVTVTENANTIPPPTGPSGLLGPHQRLQVLMQRRSMLLILSMR